MFKPTRRGFLVGCSAAIATWSTGLSFTAFGSSDAEPNQEILIVVFLRGGADGISIVPPIADADRALYESRRSQLSVPVSGASAALPLDSRFGLHPGAAPLLNLFQDKKLAIVHAAGLTSATRSHFDAQQFMELGTPDSRSAVTGWLTRHLESATNLPAQVVMPALSTGNLSPTSLLGSREAVGMTTPDQFTLGGHWKYEDYQRIALRKMYTGTSWLHEAGVQTLDALDVVELANPGTYTPGNGAVYESTDFGRSLQTVAQVIRMQLGLRVATIDLGGWDTHEYQGDHGTGYFFNLLDDMARGIDAFFTDMSDVNGSDQRQRVTMVVMSEFGRSLQENASHGTDHGHGNIMFVAGGKVNGGKVYGDWPGLTVDSLFDQRDLEIMTDYRRVLSEILIRRLGNPQLGTIFPGYGDYAPLGIVQGADLTPIYNGSAPDPQQYPNRTFLPNVRQQR